MKATRFILAGVALMVAACGNNEKDYDATGTFEATETTVFAEQSGTLLSFDVNEGDMIEATCHHDLLVVAKGGRIVASCVEATKQFLDTLLGRCHNANCHGNK